MRSTTMILLAMLCAIANVQADEIPSHPRELTFKPYDFQLPDPAKYRNELSNGVAVFMAPSAELPLITIDMRFFGGTYLDAAGKEGLHGIMGSLMRTGGTKSKTAEEVDEQFDFWAAQAGTGTDQYFVSASLNCLKQNFDDAFGLFIDVIRNPAFQADRMALLKDQMLEGMKQRNDDANSILGREWGALLYGRDHFKGRHATKKSVDSISEADLRTVHQRLIHPGGLVISVTGDFEPQAMLQRLEKLMNGWEKKDRPAKPADTAATFNPGVYHVEKDVNQGKVNIGMRAVQLGHPDLVGIQVMDQILGAGGFTSRITRRIRADEGLAYSAWSRTIPGTYFGGEFRASFSTKSSTVAFASKIVRDEVNRMRNELVSEEDLDVAKKALIEGFPSQWGSEAQRCQRMMEDELRGRPFEYWRTFRDKVKALSTEDIRDIAKRHLDPAKMAIMVVGKWEDIAPGDREGRATMKEFGEVQHLPLRDPLTQEPIQPE
ncbi:MAG: pitrilysin family protein [Planctomycetota bacterium]